MALVQFSVQQALKSADLIGPETSKLVSELLNVAYPLKFLRRVQGILRLYQSAKVSRDALEYGCKMGLTYKKLQYKYIQSTSEYFDKNGNKPSIVHAAPRREASSMHLHNSFEREEK